MRRRYYNVVRLCTSLCFSLPFVSIIRNKMLFSATHLFLRFTFLAHIIALPLTPSLFHQFLTFARGKHCLIPVYSPLFTDSRTRLERYS